MIAEKIQKGKVGPTGCYLYKSHEMGLLPKVPYVFGD